MRSAPVLIAALIFPSCVSVDRGGDAFRKVLVGELELLDFSAPAQPSGELGEYCADFDNLLDIEGPTTRYLGYLPSGDYRIFVHVLGPGGSDPDPGAGTAFIFHGFATDSSRYTVLARTLLRNGWWVVLSDLPGHGLSTGERGGAPDFSIYGDAVRTVVEGTAAHLPHPFFAFGHSTGATAIMDYTLRGGDGFSAVVFYEPLVKTAFQPVLSSLRFLSRPWIRTLRTTSNTILGVRRFPVSWFDALRRWEYLARPHKTLGLPRTLVIQGTEGLVTDNRYNRRFIEQRTAAYRFLLIQGAAHHEPESPTPHPGLLMGIMDYIGEL